VCTAEWKTRLIAAYQLRKSIGAIRSKSIRDDTVWSQHQRYFQKKGIFHNPRKMSNKQLLAQLKQWRSAGEKIGPFADLNEDIYEGKIAKLV